MDSSHQQWEETDEYAEGKSDQVGGRNASIENECKSCVDCTNYADHERSRMAIGGVLTQRETMLINPIAPAESWPTQIANTMADSP